MHAHKREEEKNTFVAHVKAAIDNLSHTHALGKLHIMRKSVQQLHDLVPPPPPDASARADAAVLRKMQAFDAIDMLFVDGDDNLLPWDPASAPLLRLLLLCVTSSKPVFGCGCAVPLVTYLAHVGAVALPVRCGTLSTFAPLAADASFDEDGVRLDVRTGDLFVWRRVLAAGGGAWEPIGNVGLKCASRHDAHGMSERKPSEVNRSAGVATCHVAPVARFHWLFRGIVESQFSVSQRNEWSAEARTGAERAIETATGSATLRVLATSQLGVCALECRNLVAMQFRPDAKCSPSLAVLRNFVVHKAELLQGDPAAASTAGGAIPQSISRLAAREMHDRDFVQSVYDTLGRTRCNWRAVGGGVTPAAGGFASASTSAVGGRGRSRPGSVTVASLFDASRPGSAAPLFDASRPGSAAILSRPCSADEPWLGSARLARATTSARPKSAATTVRPQPEVAAARSMSRPASSSLRMLRRPSTVGSAASVGSGTAGGSAATWGADAGQFRVDASSALIYLEQSSLALAASNSNLRETVCGAIGAPGCAEDLSIYENVPKYGPNLSRVSSRGSSRRGARTQSAATDPSAAGRDPLGVAPQRTTTAEAVATRVARGASIPEVRVRAAAHKPFSNWHKYKGLAAEGDAKIERKEQFLMSKEPYVSAEERERAAERRARAGSVHARVYFSASRIAQSEYLAADRRLSGFRAAGYSVPKWAPKRLHEYGTHFDDALHVASSRLPSGIPKRSVFF